MQFYVIKFKELVKNNSLLLEENHELKYKLNKTNELREQQIRDLESSVEHSNNQTKEIRGKWWHSTKPKQNHTLSFIGVSLPFSRFPFNPEQYEEQIFDLKKQIEAMDAQIKSDKAFIEQQISERELEREDYEAKIKELKLLLTKKSTALLENEETINNRVSNLFSH